MTEAERRNKEILERMDYLEEQVRKEERIYNEKVDPLLAELRKLRTELAEQKLPFKVGDIIENCYGWRVQVKHSLAGLSIHG